MQRFTCTTARKIIIVGSRLPKNLDFLKTEETRQVKLNQRKCIIREKTTNYDRSLRPHIHSFVISVDHAHILNDLMPNQLMRCNCTTSVPKYLLHFPKIEISQYLQHTIYGLLFTPILSKILLKSWWSPTFFFEIPIVSPQELFIYSKAVVPHFLSLPF